MFPRSISCLLILSKGMHAIYLYIELTVLGKIYNATESRVS